MTDAPEFDAEMFSIALAEKLKKFPDLTYTPDALTLVTGKPIEIKGKKFSLDLTLDEKREWLQAVDGFMSDPSQGNIEPIVRLNNSLLDNPKYDSSVPRVNITRMGKVEKRSLLGCSAVEMNNLKANIRR